jgi:hypothetical protein
LAPSGAESVKGSDVSEFGGEDWWDDPADPILALQDERWYPTTLTLPTGHLFSIGGSVGGVSFVYPENNTPTFELHPPTKPRSTPLQILWDTLPANLYPFTVVLPSGRMFVHASDRATLLDPRRGYEALDTFQLVVNQVPAGVTVPQPANGQTEGICLSATASTGTGTGGGGTTALGMFGCLLESGLNQNVSAVSGQTFAFWGVGIQKFEPSVHSTGRALDRGDGLIYNTGSRRCLAVLDANANAGNGVGLTRCEERDSNQVFRIDDASRSIRHVGSGRCLDVSATGGIVVA